MSGNSCLYTGWVKHQRLRIKPYKFSYKVVMMLIDLDELDDLFKNRLFWSVGKRNWVEFREEDYLKNIIIERQNLDDLDKQSQRYGTSLKLRIAKALKDAGETYRIGKILLLTQMRYMGFRMNPVSFFYCYDSETNRLKNIIAEVNNTPWDQQHLYILKTSSNKSHVFQVQKLAKSFHVSPFMPMDMTYQMRFSLPEEQVKVSIKNYHSSRLHFKATMQLKRSLLTGSNLAKSLCLFPLATVRVFSGIYWQALKLFLRGAKYYPNQEKSHPPLTKNEM